jgi:protocatechuate 3,4-dioxygenase beta subunit
MSEKEIFNSPEKVCLLGPSPEGETGPYWLPGERVRSHIREGQPGVPVVIEQQYIDVESCKPVPDLYAEIWGCNATGVYSGLVADGNGNSADVSNRNRTFLRGIQKTDSDGVVTFDTLFPGHYDSRTTHYHNIAHFHAERLPNNTIAGGRVSHVAQIFWDQDIINAVESTYPYSTNNIPITPNAEDRWWARRLRTPMLTRCSTTRIWATVLKMDCLLGLLLLSTCLQCTTHTTPMSIQKMVVWLLMVLPMETQESLMVGFLRLLLCRTRDAALPRCA